jgi:hypothetical protein
MSMIAEKRAGEIGDLSGGRRETNERLALTTPRTHRVMDGRYDQYGHWLEHPPVARRGHRESLSILRHRESEITHEPRSIRWAKWRGTGGNGGVARKFFGGASGWGEGRRDGASL